MRKAKKDVFEASGLMRFFVGSFVPLAAVAALVLLLAPAPAALAGGDDGELEFCTYNLDLAFGQSFNIRNFVRFKDGDREGDRVDWSQAFFTYTDAEADDPVSAPKANWHLSDFNAGAFVEVGPGDAESGTGNHGDGRFRIYLARPGQDKFDDHMTIRVSEEGDDIFDAMCPGVVGDFVWDDSAAPDGLQEAIEPGIGGVNVILLEDANGDGAVDGGDIYLDQTYTSPDGRYYFAGLVAGDYLAAVADRNFLFPGDPLYQFVPTLAFQGGDPSADSNGQASLLGSAAAFTLEEDDSVDLTVDFGFVFSPPDDGDDDTGDDDTGDDDTGDQDTGDNDTGG